MNKKLILFFCLNVFQINYGSCSKQSLNGNGSDNSNTDQERRILVNWTAVKRELNIQNSVMEGSSDTQLDGCGID